MTTQTVLVAIASSFVRHPTSTSSSCLPGSVVGDVRTTGVVQQMPSPDSLPLRAASTIAAMTSVGDLVADDERQVRLRQEARLEHAPAVLVRDPALAAVADRLDHRHADVARLLLDRVDHRLDALADHDRLDLDHPRLLASDQQKSPRTPES